MSRPFVGSANPIRGVNGGGLPWQIAQAEGKLRADGRLEVEVEGLVLFDAAPVPPALRGTNPIGSFRAIVSCLTTVNGSPATANVATGPFPATSTGDSEIDREHAEPLLRADRVRRAFSDDVVRRDGRRMRKP